METKHSYEVNLSWKDTKRGELFSPVLHQEIEVATPPEFPGGIDGIWSPEHLFVSAVSSCLMTTFLAIAEYSKLEYQSLNINAKGILEKVDGKFAISEIQLNPILTISDASKEAKVVRILEKAEAACLISNSIKSNILLNPEVLISDEVLS